MFARKLNLAPKSLTEIVYEYVSARLHELNEKGCENCGSELKAEPIHHTWSREYKVVVICESCKRRTLID
jgi:hypothetical protein